MHDQGGIAIPAHPLVPYPLCAQGFVLRRLLAGDARSRPDAIEAFNPTTLGKPRAVSQNGGLHRNTRRPVTIAGSSGDDVAGPGDGGAKLPTIKPSQPGYC